MMSVEGPLASWLLGLAGPAGKRLRQRLAADHVPISERQANPSQRYMAFCAFVAVAPSNSPKPLPLVDLMDQAHDFVHRYFPGVFPAEPGYAGHELVRYETQPADGQATQNRIIFFPSGLVELHWVLTTPPVVRLPLDELVGIVGCLQQAVADGAFHQLHQHHRWKRRGKVDWRIGVNAWAATPNNSVSWETVGPVGLAPQRRDAGRHPSCPPDGYATDELSSLKPKTNLRCILTPALAELLAAGGYSGGSEIRASVSRYLDRAEAPDKLQSGSTPPVVLAAPALGLAVAAGVGDDESSQVSVQPITAETIIDAFRAHGLPVPNPRDNSHNCNNLGCRQMITTDAITVVIFDTEEAATRYADAASGDAYHRRSAVLSYAAARTASEARSKYEDVLDKLL